MISRLRILHVTCYSAGAWAYGGIPRVADALTRGLARRGHDVTVCTTDACDASTRLPQQGVFTTSEGVVVRVFPNLSNRLAYHRQLFLPLGLGNYLREHAASFDVAHLHACRNLPCAMAASYLRRAGVPYVIAPNGTAPRIERRQLAKRVFDVVAGHRTMAGAARLLAVSDAERRQLCDLGVDPSIIRLVPNPIDLDEFLQPGARGRFRRRFGLSSAPLVMFLGKLTPRKRLDVLIKAFAQVHHQDARLVVAGNDMGSGVEARSLVRSMGLESRTLFTGLLRGGERLEALVDADVLVYPSQDEIFGLVPLEALMSGTSVIVADDSGCGEVVRAVGGGQVLPLGNVEMLARAIDGVLEAPAGFGEMARAAAIRIRAAFGSDVVCSQLDKVYTGLVTPEMNQSTGVSFVVPVHNGAACIYETLAAIFSQTGCRSLEVIVVDDRSEDESSEILLRLASIWPLSIIAGEGRGAAAALNAGVRAARFPIICQVDQDVVLAPDWTSRLVAELEDPAVGAAQGYFVSDPAAPLAARVMGLDLEQRYSAIRGLDTDHVCTGNSAYRAEALYRAGLFDETLGYGYDNDMSYRLREAGYRLTLCREARSRHRWRAGLGGYVVQQYGFGYGRIDVVAKHPKRFNGDAVSPAGMMSHPIAMGVALAGLASAPVAAIAGGPWSALVLGALSLTLCLAVERAAAGFRAWRRFGDRAAFWFPAFHLVRDLAWVAAIAVWVLRRILRKPAAPSHSMSPRRPAPASVRTPPTRILALIPAHNEAANLSAVIADLKAWRPDLEILVVDDGSTDETCGLLEQLEVRWLRLPEQMGIGSAVRTGLRYAARLGVDVVVRLDGDGQHGADDIDRLLAPLYAGTADVVLGSRYTKARTGRPGARGLAERLLAACLSALTGRRVTDPTSGFCAIGSRAIGLLAEHYPSGYPEPELCLLLSRNALTAVEVPVRVRARLNGKTSLTPSRIVAAGARVLLAMFIVPLRPVEERARD